MILTHIWSRITCRWSWVWLDHAAWAALAHIGKAAAVLVCVAVGGIGWSYLPPEVPYVPSYAPPVAAGPGAERGVVVATPEPGTLVVLVTGIVGLVVIRVRTVTRS